MVLEPVTFLSHRRDGPPAEVDGYAVDDVPQLVLERRLFHGLGQYWSITHLSTGRAVGFQDADLARLARYLERLGPLTEWVAVTPERIAEDTELRRAVRRLYDEHCREQDADNDIFEVALEMTREAVNAQLEAAP